MTCAKAVKVAPRPFSWELIPTRLGAKVVVDNLGAASEGAARAAKTMRMKVRIKRLPCIQQQRSFRHRNRYSAWFFDQLELLPSVCFPPKAAIRPAFASDPLQTLAHQTVAALFLLRRSSRPIEPNPSSSIIQVLGSGTAEKIEKLRTVIEA